MQTQYLDQQRQYGSLEHILFGLKLYDTVEFVTNLNAYQTKEEELPSGLFITEAQQLLLPSVMHIYNHDGNHYISPREDPNALED